MKPILPIPDDPYSIDLAPFDEPSRITGWRRTVVWLAVLGGSWIVVAGIVVWVMALAKAMQ